MAVSPDTGSLLAEAELVPVTFTHDVLELADLCSTRGPAAAAAATAAAAAAGRTGAGRPGGAGEGAGGGGAGGGAGGSAASASGTVRSGTTVDVPLWLARILVEQEVAHADLPDSFVRCMGNLVAEPTSVALPAEGLLHFYDVGDAVASMRRDERLADVLRSSFEQRCRHVLDGALNIRNTDLNRFLAPLSAEERRLFVSAYASSVEFEHWKSGVDASGVIRPSRWLLHYGGGGRARGHKRSQEEAGLLSS